MLEKFQEIIENRHEYAKDWKAKTGGKVFGYFCCYPFEELVYAAGILPVRIFGGHEPQEVSAPYMYSSMWCPFSRNSLAEGLMGHFDYVDGIFMGKACIHIRQSFTAWQWHIPTTTYSHFISIPTELRDDKIQWYMVAELEAFKDSLEKHIGKTISKEDLEKAIEVYDTNRRLMRQLYELRKDSAPCISGAEVMEVGLAGMMMDKEEHNRLLEQALEELPKRTDKPEPGVRLIMIGGELDDPSILRVIEGEGANIVIDDMCFGTRYFWNETVPGDDPLAALAARYIAKPACPIKDNTRELRKEHISALIDEYNVEAAWLIHQKFCDPQEFDMPILAKWLKEEKGLTSYRQEVDTTTPAGQLSTRAGAFLETLTIDFV